MSDTDNTIKINDPSPQDRREECDKELIDSSVPGAAFGDKDAEPPLVSVDKEEIQENAQPESEPKISGDDETGYDEIKEIDPQPDAESDVKEEAKFENEVKEIPDKENGVEESKEGSKEETKTDLKEEEKFESILPPSVPPTPDTSTPKESKIEIPTGPSVNIYKPNTLTILINTKIRNHRLLRYNPSMTIPGEQSNVVCFDPLVRLNRNIVDNIPKDQPEDEKYTQFFRRNEFNSLLMRSLSSFGNMQSVRTFRQATEEGITDNNIQITLETLFSHGSPFEIGGQKYTVDSFDWILGDWQIDTRPNRDQQIRFLPYGVAFPKNYIPNFHMMARVERDTIPDVAIKGDGLESTSKLRKAIKGLAGTIVMEPLDKDSDIREYRPGDIIDLMEEKKEHPERFLNPEIISSDVPNLPEPQKSESQEDVPIPQPDSGPTLPEPVPQPDPTPNVEPSKDPIPDEEPKPNLNNVEPEPEPVPEPVPEPDPETIPDPDTNAQKKPEPKITPDSLPEPPSKKPELNVVDVNKEQDEKDEQEEKELEEKKKDLEEEQEQRMKIQDEQERTDEEGEEELKKEFGEDEGNDIVEAIKELPQDISFLISQFTIPEPAPSEDTPNAPVTNSQKVVYEFKNQLVQEATLGFFRFITELQRLFKITPISGNKSLPFKIDGLSKNMDKDIERWEVEKNDGKGDCFFEALSTILNNNDDSKNPIVPRELNIETGMMEPIQTENPYKTEKGAYNVYRLRKAVSDYLKKDSTMIENLVNNVVPPNLPDLVAKQKRLNEKMLANEEINNEDILTADDEQTINNYKWMLNKDDTELMSIEKIIDVISVPQNSTNRRGSIQKIIKNKKLKYLDDKNRIGKYYWGDEIALTCLEKIFNIKFCPLIISFSFTKNNRVSFKEDGETMKGTIKSINREKKTYTIVTDLYEQVEKTKSELTGIQTLQLRPFFSELVPDKDTQIAFFYYTDEREGGGHYEAISKKALTSRRSNSTLFSQDKLASFLSFTIFRSICGFDQDGEFSYLQGDSVYLQFPKTKNSLDDVINRMYKIYSGLENPSKKDVVDKPVRLLDVQVGGVRQEVQKYVQTYIQNSSGLNAKNTYYIVIDLDLFPDIGRPLSTLEKFRMRCGNTKDRIREAAADAFGFYYVPGEMDTSRLKEDVPVAEAVPVEDAPVGGYKTKKRRFMPNKTRKMGGGLIKKKRGKDTLKKLFKPILNTRKFFYPH